MKIPFILMLMGDKSIICCLAGLEIISTMLKRLILVPGLVEFRIPGNCTWFRLRKSKLNNARLHSSAVNPASRLTVGNIRKLVQIRSCSGCSRIIAGRSDVVFKM